MGSIPTTTGTTGTTGDPWNHEIRSDYIYIFNITADIDDALQVKMVNESEATLPQVIFLTSVVRHPDFLIDYPAVNLVNNAYPATVNVDIYQVEIYNTFQGEGPFTVDRDGWVIVTDVTFDPGQAVYVDGEAYTYHLVTDTNRTYVETIKQVKAGQILTSDNHNVTQKLVGLIAQNVTK